MNKVYVFGHKNPDSDSICSSIVYSNFLKKNEVDSEVRKLGEMNNETKFILKKAKAKEPKTITKADIKSDDQIVLMDHNEATQSIDGIEEMKIIEIVDHHKFNLKTKEPLNITSRPVGSSCTIVADILMTDGYEINKTEAILLISAIISDTLYFRSPTTTDDDKYFVEELNEIAEIEDLEKYSLEMFAAKSDLGNISAEELVRCDYKVFEFNKNKYGIGVLETTNPGYALGRIDEAIDAMKKMKAKDGLNGIFLSVVDIINEKNTTILATKEDILLAEKIFKKKAGAKTIDLGPMISRKKQIVPAFESYFKK